MFIEGSNPYAVDSWAAPYPPFYFIFLSGVLIVSSGFNLARPTTELIFALRLAALFFDIATGLVIYMAFNRKNVGFVKSLAITSLYFIVSTGCQVWFHGDSFGFFFLALAGFFFVSKRYSLGSLFLGLSVILKIHPALSLLPVAIWFFRRKEKFSRNMVILGASVLLGLIIPLMLIPHSFEALIGYNSSTRPLYTHSLFNVFYTILPVFFQQQVSLSLINTLWITATFSMMAVVSFSVWRSPERFELIDVLVLGLVAWILPLRQVHNFYLIWYTIPFLMRGNLPKSIIMVSLQVIAAFVAPFCWVGFTDWSILPTPTSTLCFFAIAILYAACGGLVFSATLLNITLKTPPRSVRV